MAGTSPRVSGTVCASRGVLHCGMGTPPSSGGRREVKQVLSWIWLWPLWCLEKFSDRPSMHKVCADEPGEGERAFDDSVDVLGQAQQQKGYERDRYLNANGVLGGSQEVADFQGCLTHRKNNSIAHRRL